MTLLAGSPEVHRKGIRQRLHHEAGRPRGCLHRRDPERKLDGAGLQPWASAAIRRAESWKYYGPESSGKTTLALHAIAQCQKAGGRCAFIDAENAIDPLYAKALGVDIDELILSQPDSGEQALEITEVLDEVRSDRPGRHRLGRGAGSAGGTGRRDV
jgi:hypothetical protein